MVSEDHQNPVGKQLTKPKTNSWSPKCFKCNAHGHKSSDCFLDNSEALEAYLKKHPNSEKYWCRRVELYKASTPKQNPSELLKRAGPLPVVRKLKTQFNNERNEERNDEVFSGWGAQLTVPAYHEGMGLSWDEQIKKDRIKHMRILKWVEEIPPTNTHTELDSERMSNCSGVSSAVATESGALG